MMHWYHCNLSKKARWQNDGSNEREMKTGIGEKDTAPSWLSRNSQTRQKRKERTRFQNVLHSVTNLNTELCESSEE